MLLAMKIKVAVTVAALASPIAKRTEAYFPATGSSAFAASAASLMWMPWVKRVAPQATMMKKAMMSVMRHPSTTSHRDAP